MATQQEPQRSEIELVEAELALARALQRISALRRAALHGSYDSTAFDRAITEYRDAETRLTQVRRGRSAPMVPFMRLTQGSPAPLAEAVRAAADQTASDPPSEPIEPTPRLLFARWLAQTGRLSEWGPEGRSGTGP
jgi:hypothetical protein